jgi:hypothetical protein
MAQTTHVIEVGDVTAGIVVATEGGFRFFAAGLRFKSLDLTIFPSIADASRAARAKLARHPPEIRMNTNSLLIAITAIVTVLFLSAFRVQAASEASVVPIGQLGRKLAVFKHCEPFSVGTNLS